MILDRTWNKKYQKLTVSYVDKTGSRQFYEKYLHHIKTYEYDPDGEFDTWDGKKCRKVFKDTAAYKPTDFDILELLYELPEDLNKQLHAQNFPKLYTCDIETEVSDKFPDPMLAEQKVTAISLVGPDLSCIVYGLHDMNDTQKQTFADRYKKFISENEFASKTLNGAVPKVLYQYFNTEEDMLKHFFTAIIPKIGCLAGWNWYGFDWPYLTNRLKRLFGEGAAYNMIRKASPTNEVRSMRYEDFNGLHHSLPAPAHSVLIDYMKIVEQYDYVLRPYESYSLDWVANKAVDAHKIKYDGSLQHLYEADWEWYYFYNAIDSLLVMLIHYKLKSLESPCAVSSVTLVPLLDAFGQVKLTEANVFEEFYNMNKKVVYDYGAIERIKEAYKGAFCDCVPGRWELCVCDDFASLYPMQIQTCNFSFENLVPQPMTPPDSLGRRIPMAWTEEELQTYRADPKYFVSLMNNVYRNDQDFAFKTMQRRIKQNRDVFKYTGQKIDSELLTYIEDKIKEKSETGIA